MVQIQYVIGKRRRYIVSLSSFMRYWKSLIKDKDKDKLVFVGRWGDTVRDGVKPLWTDISKKTEEQLINLAIVRIKEEQDFFPLNLR